MVRQSYKIAVVRWALVCTNFRYRGGKPLTGARAYSVRSSALTRAAVTDKFSGAISQRVLEPPSGLPSAGVEVSTRIHTAQPDCSFPKTPHAFIGVVQEKPQ